MDRVLEETKALLQTLLERFDVLSHDNPVSDRDDSQLIGVPCNSKDPAWAEIPETCRDDKLHRKLILP
jgi:hypothetical protein